MRDRDPELTPEQDKAKQRDLRKLQQLKKSGMLFVKEEIIAGF